MSLQPHETVEVYYTLRMKGTFEILPEDLEDPNKSDEQVLREIIGEVGLHDYSEYEVGEVHIHSRSQG